MSVQFLHKLEQDRTVKFVVYTLTLTLQSVYIVEIERGREREIERVVVLVVAATR